MEKSLPSSGPIAIHRAFAVQKVAAEAHAHDADRLLYTIRGTARATCGGEAFNLCLGTTLHIPANVAHSVSFDAGWEGLEICLAAPAAAKIGPAITA
jgi:quercetin dioxygenase-like cupin family protein